MKKKQGLLFLADLHLGANSDLGVGKDGVNLRDLDKVELVGFLADFCKDHGVKGVVICGDLYHFPNPKSSNRKVAADIVKSFSEVCPVIVIPGNHDYGKDGCSLIEGLYDIKNVNVVNRPEIISLGDRNLVCVPHCSSGSGIKFEEAFIELIGAYGGNNAILVGHVSALGSISSTDFEMRGAEDIDFSRMKSNKISLCVLGHIHRHQCLRSANYPVIYPGSVVRLSFGERKEIKGFLWVGRKDDWRFYPYMDRQIKFYTIGVEDDGRYSLPKNWGERIFSGAIIRVVLSGSREALVQYSDSVSSHVNDTFVGCAAIHIIRSVSSQSEVKVRSEKLAGMARGGINIKSAVKEYVDVTAPEKTKKFLIKTGNRIIRGENLAEEI